MARFLFLAAVWIETGYIGLFILAIRKPAFRFWPPPSARSWQFFTAWFLAGIVVILFFFTGLLDFDSAWLPPLRQRFPFAAAAFLISSGLGFWIYRTFPFRATLGLETRLVTTGPYRFSRNPQYVSDFLSILGWMILTNSRMSWVIGFLGMLLNLLAPFAEEPWLEERYGEAYRAYKARTPRFFGIPNTDLSS